MDATQRSPGPVFLWLSLEDWFSIRARQTVPPQIRGSVRLFIECFRNRAVLKRAVDEFLLARPGSVHDVGLDPGFGPPMLTVAFPLNAGEEAAEAVVRLGHDLYSHLRQSVLRELGA